MVENEDLQIEVEEINRKLESKEDKKIMQILELPEQKFFLATQFHPEFTSRPLNPNPIFVRFVKNCLD